MALSEGVTRTLLGTSHFMAWLSSAIVVGITGYFLNNYAHDEHLIYQITISALFLAFWIPSFILPFLGNYRNYFLPLDLVWTYLWLTGFIFAAQDYNRGSCWANSPSVGHCSLKLTNEAFLFLGFFFTLVGYVVEALSYVARARLTETPAIHKENRASVETAA